MRTNRQLLEWAAKAAGYTTNHRWNAERLTMNPPVDALVVHDADGLVHTAWNPLTDDGARYRLAKAVKGNLYFSGMRGCFEIHLDGDEPSIVEYFKIGDESEEGFAIVRAAAEIGKVMP